MKKRMCCVIGGLVVILAAGVFAFAADVAEGKDKAMIDDYKAKTVGLKMVSCMFLETDMDAMAKLIDPNCALDSKGPGQGQAFLDLVAEGWGELKREKKISSLGEVVSVREILFFAEQDVPELSRRFPKKADLWMGNETPAYIGGGVGCCVVTRNLSGGDGGEVEENEEVYIFVIRKVGEEYKIVFCANS